MSEALALAERALAAAGPGEQALALVEHERSLLLRFAASRPTQATAIDDLTVELAVLRSGHVGRAAGNAVDDEGLAALARRAVGAAEAAAAVAGPGRYPGFPEPAAPLPHAGRDEETARLDVETGGAALASAFAVAGSGGVEAHGVWTTGETETAVASSTGARLSDRVTDAFMKLVCIHPETRRSGYAAATGAAVADIDPGALTRRAVAKACVHGDPVELPTGPQTVVFEPHAVGTLLGLLAHCAFDGLAHAEGRGALVDRLGTRVAASTIQLADVPDSPFTLPRGFDFEGVPKAPLPLLEGGVARSVVHDTFSGALTSSRSTGHGLAVGGGTGPAPTNLVLAGGDAADEEDLCAGVERGVYVTRLWYENVVRPKETLITAVTRDGTFLIEDGRVTAPLADGRLTDNLLGILSRVEELTARARLVGAGEFYGRRFALGSVCPALRATEVNLTAATAVAERG